MAKYSGRTPEFTIGLDVGERQSYYVILDREGEVIEEGRVRTRGKELSQHFRERERARIALEAGSQSGWISRLLQGWGHEVLVANPRKLRLIYENRKKQDRVDAQYLARLARLDPRLLSPIQHRGESVQRDRVVLRSRETLVEARTKLINSVRSTLKQFGLRVSSGSSGSFARRVREQVGSEWEETLGPVVEMIEALTGTIRDLDRRIQQWGEQRYPQTKRLRQVPGVGPLTALAYVLTIEDPGRFESPREVGAYLGLCPRQDQSGGRDPQLPITKQGDRMLRRLLIQGGHYILGPFGPESELRRWGERIAGEGSQARKKRAVVAVARKLSVLLLILWRRGEPYDPFYHTNRRAA